MKATRQLKVILELTEEEARDLYIHYNPKYHPNKYDELKTKLREALGYEPREDPDI